MCDGASSREHPSADPVEAAAIRIADTYPDAIFAAVDATASPPFVRAPETLPIPRERLVEDPATAEGLRPPDRVALVKLWSRARSRGLAIAPVRTAGATARYGHLYLFDLHRRHGIMLAAFVPGDPDPEFVTTWASPPARPRFASASRDDAAVYQWVDSAFTEMLGWQPEELIGHRALEFIHPDDHEVGVANWLEMLESPGRSRPNRARHRHRDGSWIWLEVTNHNRLAEPEGDVLAQVVDISEEMAAHEALRAREQLLAQLTDTVPVGLFHVDVTGVLLYANRPLGEMTGMFAATTIEEQFAAVLAEHRVALKAAMQATAAGASSDIEITMGADANRRRHYLLSVRPLVDAEGNTTGITGSLKDVTEMVDARNVLERRAASDVLTGCLNRDATIAAIQSRLDKPGSPGGKTGTGTAVIFLDLDGFKQINDEHGHAAGDDFLVTVASSIRSTLRAEDLLGRIGGDEFVVCTSVSSPSEALRAARSLGERGFSDVSPVRASIGVAWTDELGASATGLMEAADRAMYESKRAGHGEPTLARHQPAPQGLATATGLTASAAPVG